MIKFQQMSTMQLSIFCDQCNIELQFRSIMRGRFVYDCPQCKTSYILDKQYPRDMEMPIQQANAIQHAATIAQQAQEEVTKPKE